MNLTVTEIHGVHKGHFQVDTKDITFIVECESEHYDAEYCEGYLFTPSGESINYIDITEVWRNDEDSTPIELNDKLKNQLLCLIN